MPGIKYPICPDCGSEAVKRICPTGVRGIGLTESLETIDHEIFHSIRQCSDCKTVFLA